MIRSALLAFVLTFTAAPVVAGPWEDARAAYNSGDYETTVQLWRQLAEQGNATAQFNLGLTYAIGQGVPQEHAEAARWYRMAAEQGYAPAQTNLGFMYDTGQGVPQDYVAAVKWYRKAAEQGQAQAQTQFGLMYAAGMGGLPEDKVLAYMWLRLGAALGDKKASEFRDNLAEKMTREQIAEAQKLAREWKPN